MPYGAPSFCCITKTDYVHRCCGRNRAQMRIAVMAAFESDFAQQSPARPEVIYETLAAPDRDALRAALSVLGVSE